MTYRAKGLAGGTIPIVPSMGKQLVMAPATKHAVHQAIKPQDLILGSGRRVLIEGGLRGGNRFLIRNGAAADSVSGGSVAAYPDADTYRVMARALNYPVTPGCAICIRVIAEPSGMHHGDITSDTTVVNGGSGGWVRLTATWDNGTDTTTETADLFFEGSQLANNGEPDDDGESWLAVSRDFARLMPDGFAYLFSSATNAKWCLPGTTVDLTVSYRGSPRVWDLCVYEDPQRITFDDEEAGAWPFHGYQEAHYPFDYPLSRAEDAGDLTRGQLHLGRVLAGLQTLGPSLWAWSSASEHDNGEIIAWANYNSGGLGTTGDNEAPPKTVTGATFGLLWRTATSAFAEANPSAGVGCGGYGRTAAQNGDRGAFGLRGRGGVIPVTVAAYCKASAADTTTVRVQTRPHSYIELTTVSTSYGWVIAHGWLSVGRNPEDEENVQVFAKGSDGSAVASVRDVVIYYRGP